MGTVVKWNGDSNGDGSGMEWRQQWNGMETAVEWNGDSSGMEWRLVSYI